ncbi:hypothetical protein QF002_001262 [Paraburkholderia youngii]
MGFGKHGLAKATGERCSLMAMGKRFVTQPEMGGRRCGKTCRVNGWRHSSRTVC